jgi:hypothetical protein
VLFAHTYWDTRIKSELITPQPLPWFPQELSNTALIVDLPGSASIEVGFAFVALGFRLVCLYNASPGPEEVTGLGTGSPSPTNAAIDMGPIIDAISRVTTSLQRINFPQNAAPLFLLDSSRLEGTTFALSGIFDNRWMVVPQDFPSASFLLEHGIRQTLLVQKDRLEPQDDLAHTLLRWQEGGVTVLAKRLDNETHPIEITVKRPSRYKALWYRVLAQFGLRRSSAGGFGSYIPELTSAG